MVEVTLTIFKKQNLKTLIMRHVYIVFWCY